MSGIAENDNNKSKFLKLTLREVVASTLSDRVPLLAARFELCYRCMFNEGTKSTLIARL